jgi:hypothetical protein
MWVAAKAQPQNAFLVTFFAKEKSDARKNKD